MTYPKVTLIWLNYNSNSIIDVILESLEAIRNLDYPNFELIIVDNGSTDGSFDVIREFVHKRLTEKIPVKIIRNERNLGFAGGINVGFRARSSDSKYVVLVNNDAVPEQESLKVLVEEMERRPDIGAAQGVIIDSVTGRVDSAGWYLTKYLLCVPYLRGEDCSLMRRPVYVTYAYGAFSIYRVEAVLRCNNGNFMFYDELFAYCDDNVLGLKLWNNSHKIVSFPVVTAKHYQGLTFRKFKINCLYYNLRCLSFLYHITNISFRSKMVVKYVYLKKTLVTTLAFKKASIIKLARRAWNEGKKIACKILEKEKRIDLARVPIIDMDLKDTLKFLVFTRYIHRKVNPSIIEQMYSVKD